MAIRNPSGSAVQTLADDGKQLIHAWVDIKGHIVMVFADQYGMWTQTLVQMVGHGRLPLRRY